jgi:hypothetical protein
MKHEAKHTNYVLVMWLIILLSADISLMAVENLRIAIQGNDVVLSWPSQEGETFIIQYRPRLNPETPWTTLASGYTAMSGVGQTTFIHAEIVESQSGDSGGGGGDTPPAPAATAIGDSSLSNGHVTLDEAKEKEPKKARKHPELPPVPWDPETWESNGTQGVFEVLTTASSDPVGCIGFYRVVREGIHLYGLANGTILSGIANLYFEVGSSLPEALMGLYVNTIDGQPVNGLRVFPLDPGVLQAVWDTTMVPNGVYALQPGMQIGLDTPMVGDAVTVEVRNLICFPNAWPIAGEAMRIEAQTVHANGYWMMDIYDDQDNFLAGLDGFVDENGYCNLEGYPGPGFSLSLLDNNGEQLPYNYYVVEVATFPPGSGLRAMSSASAATAKITNFVERSWMYRTRFAVAYQQFYNPDSLSGIALREMMSVVVSASGERYLNDPVRGTWAWPFVLNGPIEWEQLGADLRIREVRNFYYFGHGSPSSIGNVPANENLTIQDLRHLLVNESDNPLQGLNGHPYRFVFLDGCRSADGDLCKAFGISKGPVPLNEFVKKRGLRPRAFVGWNNKVGIDVWGQAIDQRHLEFIPRFFNHWAHGTDQNGGPITLKEALARAAVSDFGAVWDQAQHLVIHGYDGLFFEE